jgi:predicted metal-dependent hydrolase
VQQGDEDSVKCLRGYLWVTIKDKPDPKKAQKLLEGWYREHARRIFHERYEECYKKIAKEGIPKAEFRIQKMSGRWGGCSPTERIILNLELIKAPKDCIDYVIIHELYHLKEKHHGARFWRLLSRLMPDYESRVKRLVDI